MPDLSTYEGRQEVRDAAAAAGQNVTVDASGVYNQSTGQTTSGAEYVGDGDQKKQQQQQQQQQNPLGNVDIGAITRGFAASSGMSQKQLDEQIRQFDQTLEWQKQMWAQQGLPQLTIQQRAADLEEKKFGELTQQAHRQQDFVEEIGRRQATLAEKTQADANAIAGGGLGLQTLQTAAGLSGPADWIKAANFSRGVRGSTLPAFIQQLLSGRSTAALGGPAAGAEMSAPLSMGTLAGALGAGGAPSMNEQVTAPSRGAFGPGGGVGGAYALPEGMTPGAEPRYYAGSPALSDVDYAAQRLRQVYGGGGQALGPQQLEGLTPTELSMFTGGGESVGADVPGFLEQYKRSRIGQSATSGAY